jgi:hypothetical protein
METYRKAHKKPNRSRDENILHGSYAQEATKTRINIKINIIVD